MGSRKFKRNYDKDMNALVNKLEGVSSSKAWHKYLSEWLIVASHLATTFIIIWGYFYTVVPIYQKEKLLEDNARLEISKNNIKKEVDDLLRELDSIKSNNADLLGLKDKISDELGKISEMKAQVESELEIKTMELKNTKALLSRTYTELDIARSYMLIHEENTLTKMPTISPYSTMTSGMDSAPPLEAVTVDFQSILEALKTDISNTKGIRQDVLKELYHEYESGLESRGHLASCPKVNVKEWGAAKTEAVSEISDGLESCSSENTAAQCYKDVQFYVERYMMEQAFNYKQACINRIHMSTRIILGDIKVSDIPAIQTNPPPITKLKEYVLEMLGDH